MGKLSGKHAFAERLKQLGYVLEGEELNEAFKKFKDVADRKREVTDEDLEAIASQKVSEVPAIYEMQSFRIYCGNGMESIANLILKRDGNILTGEAMGTGRRRCVQGDRRDSSIKTYAGEVRHQSGYRG